MKVWKYIAMSGNKAYACGLLHNTTLLVRRNETCNPVGRQARWKMSCLQKRFELPLLWQTLLLMMYHPHVIILLCTLPASVGQAVWWPFCHMHSACKYFSNNLMTHSIGILFDWNFLVIRFKLLPTKIGWWYINACWSFNFFCLPRIPMQSYAELK